MKLKINDCIYELVRDLLVSHDSLIKDVEKEKDGVIVTLQDNSSQKDLESFLSSGPLHTFCAYSKVTRV